MTKYTRSIEDLMTTIDDIFADSEISIDTRSIVLLLAASLPCTKFNAWIDKISALNTLNAKFKVINAIRFTYGENIRDFIILSILQTVKHDVDSNELQRFINESNNSLVLQQHIVPALTQDDLAAQRDLYTENTTAEFIQLKLAATECLNQLFTEYSSQSLQHISEAYLRCRRVAEPTMAYFAVVQAMADILHHSGITAPEAQQASEKLASYALSEFIAGSLPANAILHAYSNISP